MFPALAALVCWLCAVTTLQAQEWSRVAPTNVRQPGILSAGRVRESSGITPSRRYPGKFWTLNDSGNPATLFLVDTTGKVSGFSRLLGTQNDDWEALTGAPCGAELCLYVGEIGDNRQARPTVTIFRVLEPNPATLKAGATRVRDSLLVRYPNGPADAEALVATSSGDLAIITKGRSRPPDALWIPASAWAKPRTVALSLGQLAVPTSLLLLNLVTDAALSPDQNTLAVRTYKEIYLFRRGPSSRQLPDVPLVACPIDGLEPRGEAIAWWNPRELLLTSEITRSRPGPITLLECHAP